MDTMEGETDFITFHRRPKRAISVSTQSCGSEQSKSVAIVMQGPLVYKDNFTLETVKIYQRQFVGSKISETRDQLGPPAPMCTRPQWEFLSLKFPEWP